MSTQMFKRRAVIYTRVSRDDSGEGKSNDRQEAEAKRLIEYKRWQIVQVDMGDGNGPQDAIRDVSKSAFGGTNRPGWNKVLEMIRNGEVDCVVAYAMDRMTRNMIDLEKLIILADEHGVGIATVDGDIDLTSEMGRMIARILGAVARAEVEVKARRQRLTNDQRAAEGKPWAAGARPFGYADDHITIVPEEAKAIREAARRALDNQSMNVIGKWLTDQGLVPARGNSKAWTPTGVRKMLTNPRYAGMRVHRGKNIGPAIWEPVLDPDTHFRLVEREAGNRSKLSPNSGRTGPKAQTLLTGIMTCSKCQEPEYGSKKRDTPTYTCQKTHHYIEREAADNFVQGRTIARLMQPDLIDQLRTAPTSVPGPAPEDKKVLEDRLSMLNRLLGKGKMTEEDYEEAADEVRAAMADLRVNAAPDALPPEFEGLLIGTDAVRTQWIDLSLNHKRSIIAALFDIELLPKGRSRKIVKPVDEQVIITDGLTANAAWLKRPKVESLK